MTDYEQNAISAAAWKWQAPKITGDQPGNRIRRALIQAGIACAIAALIYFCLHQLWLSVIIVCISGILVYLAAASGPAFDAIENGIKKFSVCVGVVMTWILLVPFFYICFGTGRLFLQLAGKDPMTRKFPGGKDTYWVPRQPVTDQEHYSRQY